MLARAVLRLYITKLLVQLIVAILFRIDGVYEFT